jgi:peptidoglycan/LPS O-acetylase OafA/YrhL
MIPDVAEVQRFFIDERISVYPAAGARWLNLGRCLQTEIRRDFDLTIGLRSHCTALKRRSSACRHSSPLQRSKLGEFVEKRVNSLQYGRALAASAVLAHHSMLAAAQIVQRPPSLVEEIVTRGYLGVDFFFVLSGFIILHTHLKDRSDATAAGIYLTKRLRRVYVPYLPVSIVLIAFYLLLPSVSLGSRDWGFLTSLTLIPTERPPALSVAWTLIHEMIFYLIFSLSYFTRHFIIAVVVWMISIVAVWAIGWKSNISALSYLLSPQNLEFIVGMASAYGFSKLSTKWSPLLIGCGLVSILSYIAVGALDQHRTWFGVSLAPIILGVAMLERAKAPSPITWLLLIGNASYAIYLVHNPVVSIAVRLGRMVSPSWELAFMLCVTSGLLAGLAYHVLIEMPGMKLAAKLPLSSLGLHRNAPVADGSRGTDSDEKVVRAAPAA